MQEQWKLMWKLIPGTPQPGETILDLGSGFGGFVNNSYQNKLIGFGIEVDRNRITLSNKLLSIYGNPQGTITNSAGENLPFADNSFNYIFSTNVIEHVAIPEEVISEAIRVLKPGGYAQIIIPSYNSWWEGHYGILWLPGMSKRIAKFYVRLFKRNPDQIDTLQFITPKWMMKIFKVHEDKVEVLDWGISTWEDRVRNMNFSEWASLGLLKRMLTWVHKLRFTEILIWLGKKLNWETPIIITFRKIG
jgi:ubiquinone/menaquinone biosynthesis C-methylase UbiE